jgi:phage FluMu protein Com
LESLQSIRCGKCSALLLKAAPGAIAGTIEIKCRRCGHVITLRPPEPEPKRRDKARGGGRCLEDPP